MVRIFRRGSSSIKTTSYQSNTVREATVVAQVGNRLILKGERGLFAGSIGVKKNTPSTRRSSGDRLINNKLATLNNDYSSQPSVDFNKKTRDYEPSQRSKRFRKNKFNRYIKKDLLNLLNRYRNNNQGSNTDDGGDINFSSNINTSKVMSQIGKFTGDLSDRLEQATPFDQNQMVMGYVTENPSIAEYSKTFEIPVKVFLDVINPVVNKTFYNADYLTGDVNSKRDLNTYKQLSRGSFNRYSGVFSELKKYNDRIKSSFDVDVVLGDSGIRDIYNELVRLTASQSDTEVNRTAYLAFELNNPDFNTFLSKSQVETAKEVFKLFKNSSFPTIKFDLTELRSYIFPVENNAFVFYINSDSVFNPVSSIRLKTELLDAFGQTLNYNNTALPIIRGYEAYKYMFDRVGQNNQRSFLSYSRVDDNHPNTSLPNLAPSSLISLSSPRSLLESFNRDPDHLLFGLTLLDVLNPIDNSNIDNTNVNNTIIINNVNSSRLETNDIITGKNALEGLANLTTVEDKQTYLQNVLDRFTAKGTPNVVSDINVNNDTNNNFVSSIVSKLPKFVQNNNVFNVVSNDKKKSSYTIQGNVVTIVNPDVSTMTSVANELLGFKLGSVEFLQSKEAFLNVINRINNDPNKIKSEQILYRDLGALISSFNISDNSSIVLEQLVDVTDANVEQLQAAKEYVDNAKTSTVLKVRNLSVTNQIDSMVFDNLRNNLQRAIANTNVFNDIVISNILDEGANFFRGLHNSLLNTETKNRPSVITDKVIKQFQELFSNQELFNTQVSTETAKSILSKAVDLTYGDYGQYLKYGKNNQVRDIIVKGKDVLKPILESSYSFDVKAKQLLNQLQSVNVDNKEAINAFVSSRLTIDPNTFDKTTINQIKRGVKESLSIYPSTIINNLPKLNITIDPNKVRPYKKGSMISLGSTDAKFLQRVLSHELAHFAVFNNPALSKYIQQFKAVKEYNQIPLSSSQLNAIDSKFMLGKGSSDKDRYILDKYAMYYFGRDYNKENYISYTESKFKVESEEILSQTLDILVSGDAKLIQYLMTQDPDIVNFVIGLLSSKAKEGTSVSNKISTNISSDVSNLYRDYDADSFDPELLGLLDADKQTLSNNDLIRELNKNLAINSFTPVTDKETFANNIAINTNNVNSDVTLTTLLQTPNVEVAYNPANNVTMIYAGKQDNLRLINNTINNIDYSLVKGSSIIFDAYNSSSYNPLTNTLSIGNNITNNDINGTVNTAVFFNSGSASNVEFIYAFTTINNNNDNNVTNTSLTLQNLQSFFVDTYQAYKDDREAFRETYKDTTLPTYFDSLARVNSNNNVNISNQPMQDMDVSIQSIRQKANNSATSLSLLETSIYANYLQTQKRLRDDLYQQSVNDLARSNLSSDNYRLYIDAVNLNLDSEYIPSSITDDNKFAYLTNFRQLVENTLNNLDGQSALQAIRNEVNTLFDPNIDNNTINVNNINNITDVSLTPNFQTDQSLISYPIMSTYKGLLNRDEKKLLPLFTLGNQIDLRSFSEGYVNTDNVTTLANSIFDGLTIKGTINSVIPSFTTNTNRYNVVRDRVLSITKDMSEDNLGAVITELREGNVREFAIGNTNSLVQDILNARNNISEELRINFVSKSIATDYDSTTKFILKTQEKIDRDTIEDDYESQLEFKQQIINFILKDSKIKDLYDKSYEYQEYLSNSVLRFVRDQAIPIYLDYYNQVEMYYTDFNNEIYFTVKGGFNDPVYKSQAEKSRTQKSLANMFRAVNLLFVNKYDETFIDHPVTSDEKGAVRVNRYEALGFVNEGTYRPSQRDLDKALNIIRKNQYKEGVSKQYLIDFIRYEDVFDSSPTTIIESLINQGFLLYDKEGTEYNNKELFSTINKVNVQATTTDSFSSFDDLKDIFEYLDIREHYINFVIDGDESNTIIAYYNLLDDKDKPEFLLSARFLTDFLRKQVEYDYSKERAYGNLSFNEFSDALSAVNESFLGNLAYLVELQKLSGHLKGINTYQDDRLRILNDVITSYTLVFVRNKVKELYGDINMMNVMKYITDYKVKISDKMTLFYFIDLYLMGLSDKTGKAKNDKFSNPPELINYIVNLSENDLRLPTDFLLPDYIFDDLLETFSDEILNSKENEIKINYKVNNSVIDNAISRWSKFKNSIFFDGINIDPSIEYITPEKYREALGQFAIDIRNGTPSNVNIDDFNLIVNSLKRLPESLTNTIKQLGGQIILGANSNALIFNEFAHLDGTVVPGWGLDNNINNNNDINNTFNKVTALHQNNRVYLVANQLYETGSVNPVLHEYAHLVWKNLPESVRNEWISIHEDTAGWLTNYELYLPEEAFAETFANYFNSDSSRNNLLNNLVSIEQVGPINNVIRDFIEKIAEGTFNSINSINNRISSQITPDVEENDVNEVQKFIDDVRENSIIKGEAFTVVKALDVDFTPQKTPNEVGFAVHLDFPTVPTFIDDHFDDPEQYEPSATYVNLKKPLYLNAYLTEYTPEVILYLLANNLGGRGYSSDKGENSELIMQLDSLLDDIYNSENNSWFSRDFSRYYEELIFNSDLFDLSNISTDIRSAEKRKKIYETALRVLKRSSESIKRNNNIDKTTNEKNMNEFYSLMAELGIDGIAYSYTDYVNDSDKDENKYSDFIIFDRIQLKSPIELRTDLEAITLSNYNLNLTSTYTVDEGLIKVNQKLIEQRGFTIDEITKLNYIFKDVIGESYFIEAFDRHKEEVSKGVLTTAIKEAVQYYLEDLEDVLPYQEGIEYNDLTLKYIDYLSNADEPEIIDQASVEEISAFINDFVKDPLYIVRNNSLGKNFTVEDFTKINHGYYLTPFIAQTVEKYNSENTLLKDLVQQLNKSIEKGQYNVPDKELTNQLTEVISIAVKTKLKLVGNYYLDSEYTFGDVLDDFKISVSSGEENSLTSYLEEVIKVILNRHYKDLGINIATNELTRRAKLITSKYFNDIEPVYRTFDNTYSEEIFDLSNILIPEQPASMYVNRNYLIKAIENLKKVKQDNLPEEIKDIFNYVISLNPITLSNIELQRTFTLLKDTVNQLDSLGRNTPEYVSYVAGLATRYYVALNKIASGNLDGSNFDPILYDYINVLATSRYQTNFNPVKDVTAYKVNFDYDKFISAIPYFVRDLIKERKEILEGDDEYLKESYQIFRSLYPKYQYMSFKDAKYNFPSLEANINKIKQKYNEFLEQNKLPDYKAIMNFGKTTFDELFPDFTNQSQENKVASLQQWLDDRTINADPILFKEGRQAAKALIIDDSLKAVEGKEKLIRDIYFTLYLLSKGKIKHTLEKVILSDDNRAYASPDEKLIAINIKDDVTTIYHEMGHHIEFAYQDTIALTSLQWLNYKMALYYKVPEYEASLMPFGLIKLLSELTGQKDYGIEVAYPIRSVSPYIGKLYPTEREDVINFSTEVISVAVQHLVDENEMLYLYENDRELFYYLLGVLDFEGTPQVNITADLKDLSTELEVLYTNSLNDPDKYFRMFNSGEGKGTNILAITNQLNLTGSLTVTNEVKEKDTLTIIPTRVNHINVIESFDKYHEIDIDILNTISDFNTGAKVRNFVTNYFRNLGINIEFNVLNDSAISTTTLIQEITENLPLLKSLGISDIVVTHSSGSGKRWLYTDYFNDQENDKELSNFPDLVSNVLNESGNNFAVCFACTQDSPSYGSNINTAKVVRNDNTGEFVNFSDFVKYGWKDEVIQNRFNRPVNEFVKQLYIAIKRLEEESKTSNNTVKFSTVYNYHFKSLMSENEFKQTVKQSLFNGDFQNFVNVTRVGNERYIPYKTADGEERSLDAFYFFDVPEILDLHYDKYKETRLNKQRQYKGKPVSESKFNTLQNLYKETSINSLKNLYDRLKNDPNDQFTFNQLIQSGVIGSYLNIPDTEIKNQKVFFRKDNQGKIKFIAVTIDNDIKAIFDNGVDGSFTDEFYDYFRTVNKKEGKELQYNYLKPHLHYVKSLLKEFNARGERVDTISEVLDEANYIMSNAAKFTSTRQRELGYKISQALPLLKYALSREGIEYQNLNRNYDDKYNKIVEESDLLYKKVDVNDQSDIDLIRVTVTNWLRPRLDNFDDDESFIQGADLETLYQREIEELNQQIEDVIDGENLEIHVIYTLDGQVESITIADDQGVRFNTLSPAMVEKGQKEIDLAIKRSLYNMMLNTKLKKSFDLAPFSYASDTAYTDLGFKNSSNDDYASFTADLDYLLPVSLLRSQLFETLKYLDLAVTSNDILYAGYSLTLLDKLIAKEDQLLKYPELIDTYNTIVKLKKDVQRKYKY